MPDTWHSFLLALPIFILCPFWASSSLCTCSQLFPFLDQETIQLQVEASKLRPVPSIRPNLRSQETLTTIIRAAASMWNKRMWTSKKEFKVPVHVLQNRAPCVALFVCVWRKTACLKIRYPLCSQREALPGLYSHLKNSGEDDAHVLRGIVKK